MRQGGGLYARQKLSEKDVRGIVLRDEHMIVSDHAKPCHRGGLGLGDRGVVGKACESFVGVTLPQKREQLVKQRGKEGVIIPTYRIGREVAVGRKTGLGEVRDRQHNGRSLGDPHAIQKVRTHYAAMRKSDGGKAGDLFFF